MMKNWSFPLSKTLAGNRNWRVPCERPFRSIRPLLLFWSVDTEFTSGGVTGSRPRPCQQCLLYPELTWSLSGDWYGSAWFPLLFSKWKPRKSREHNQLMNNTRQQKWLRSDRASNIISIKVFFVFVFFGWQVRVFGLLAGTSSPYETTQHQLDSVIDRPLNGGAWMMNMWQLGEIDWLQLWVWFLFLALCPHHLTPSPRTRRCLGRAEGWQVAMRPANGSSRAADRKARAAAPKDWRTSS